MDNKKIESFIRSQITELDFDNSDAEEQWAILQSKIQPKKKNRKLGIWISLVASTLLLSGSWLLYTQTHAPKALPYNNSPIATSSKYIFNQQVSDNYCNEATVVTNNADFTQENTIHQSTQIVEQTKPVSSNSLLLTSNETVTINKTTQHLLHKPSNTTIDNETNLNNNTTDKYNAITTKNIATKLAQVDASVRHIQLPKTAYPLTNKGSKKITPTHNKKPISLAIEGGSHINTWNNKGNSSETNNDFINTIESGAYGWQLGFKLRQPITTKLHLIGGLNFKRNLIQVDFQSIAKDSVFKNNAIVHIINDEGLIVNTLQGPGYMNRITTRNYTNYNALDMFQVSLGMGYLKQYKNISYGIEGEISTSYWLNSRGTRFNPNFEPMAINNTKNDFYATKSLLFSSSLSAIITYNIAPKIDVYTRPIMEVSFNNWYAPSSQLLNKPINFGLNFGIQYRL